MKKVFAVLAGGVLLVIAVTFTTQSTCALDPTAIHPTAFHPPNQSTSVYR